MSQADFLRVVKEHPEGLTTPEISRILFPKDGENRAKINKCYQFGAQLLKWQMVRKEFIPRPNQGGCQKCCKWYPGESA